MSYLDELLSQMVQHGASDLHLSAGLPPYMRANGEITAIPQTETLAHEKIEELVFNTLTDQQKQLFMETWELDCAYHLPGVGRFRTNIFMQDRGLSAVYRVIPERPKTVTELNLPSQLAQFARGRHGMILTAGPTGSGKSTTLAALVHDINSNLPKHIITLEDPIEFLHQSNKSLVQQREVLSHTRSFANGLKSALREDPDVILLGEMRDLETIQLAMTAAETGHLVFGTLHVGRAHKAVDRMIDVFSGEQQPQARAMLSESLRCVIAQTLIPKKAGGMIAAVEILVNTSAVANLIREGRTNQIPSAMQMGRREGMITFESHIENLVAQGLVDSSVLQNFLQQEKRTAKLEGEDNKPALNSANGVTGPRTGRPGMPTQAANAHAANGIATTRPPLGGGAMANNTTVGQSAAGATPSATPGMAKVVPLRTTPPPATTVKNNPLNNWLKKKAS